MSHFDLAPQEVRPFRAASKSCPNPGHSPPDRQAGPIASDSPAIGLWTFKS